MPNIVIVDYGLANLRSVQKAFERVGASAEITSDPTRILAAGHLVLPGVGAFRDASAALVGTALGDAIISHIHAGRPFLGICLGLQMLFTRGTEDGSYPGLDIISGEVVRFPAEPGLKVPHMGWNTLQFPKACPLFIGLPAEPAVYFVHGYYPQPTDPAVIAATADYPTPFCAAVWKDNIFATQFHPEKSQDVGMTILRNFTGM